MTRVPVSETIPDLEFSHSEQRDVVEMTAGVLAEALRVEQQYRAGDGGLIKRDWKEVSGGRGGFRIYKERRRANTRGKSSVSDSEAGMIELEEIDWPDTSSVDESINSDSFSGSFVSDSVPLRFVDQIRDEAVSSNESSSHSSGGASATPASVYSRVPMVVAGGHAEGHLEDVVFGSYAGDMISWQERGAYIKDGYNYSRILATILGPIPEDPYRFLGIKWFMREEKNLVYGTLIQDRDFLVVEATGLTRDEHGVPHGYYIMHSFRHPLVPEFTDRKILRCEVSLCFISRQVGPNKVHIFNRGFIDPKGALTPSMAIAVSTRRLSLCVQTVETSHARKLVWIMKQRQRTRSHLEAQHNEAMSSRVCEVCKKAFRFLSGNLSFCQVCSQCICSKCTVPQRLIVDATATGATARLLPFCAACVLEAKRLPPHEVALDTIIRDDIASSNTSSSRSSGGGCATADSIYSRVPMLVGAGHVEGHLEDVAYGLYAGDEVSWQERCSYIKDEYSDARILSTILAPTREDPYRFLGIKWFARQDSSLVFGTLIQDRDFLVVEATGLTRDEHGVPHGYYVLHSITHPQVPEFTDRKILRCDVSLCFISRQVGPNEVHIFTRGFIDPKEALPQSVAVSLATRGISSCVETVDTSHSRKLAWLMKQRQRNRTQLEPQHSEAMSSRTCEVCAKKFRFLPGNLSFCQVCSQCICSKCTVQHRLVLDATATGATTGVIPFCATCVLQAKQLPPHQVALDSALPLLAP
ncbi:hypothetical protein Poli38472_012552 [Pythium oligandrum]|uniref:FYVE-type domain-containing protein n=1 Tax=Pythium oligandrum TaxID=41045 RepID=A0A8K1CEG1_PYTOL|nr:hypothetical protein Poli38472_012552 [Pythium oligandrum]|eukprot:TMW61361.1 hypothetical protein Poli38472_012552 [Pythium oligandrum]